jgi:predicted site-specific integrase-resolvase
MTRGNTAANFPEQTIYTFAAAAKILGRHPTTLFRQAKAGTLRTVNTPVGRRIHRDEIRRQSGEMVTQSGVTPTSISASDAAR